MYPDYPPDLSQEQREQLSTVVKQWSLSHGLVVRPANGSVPSEHDRTAALVVTPAPVTLYPSLFPGSSFDEALNIQCGYNEVYARVAADEKFLGDLVQQLSQVDDFIANLWNVHSQVKREGYVQDLSLGIFRSDYMLHVSSQNLGEVALRQVEFNTIASSFGGLASRVSSLHRYLHASGAYPTNVGATISSGRLPINESINSIAAGMASAFEAYGPSKHRTGLDKCVLFIVQDDERNVYDQKHIEHAIQDTHCIPVFRLPWTKIQNRTYLGNGRALLFTHPVDLDRVYEVAVVYFRAGYSPQEYANANSWDARLHLERSAAIKCPTVLTHLAGSKKIQQVLAAPNSPWLEQFLLDQNLSQRILRTFARMYPLDDSDAGKVGQDLALNPETAAHYVLKPQREGGGNNVYRKAIPDFLKTIPKDKWSQYILMEMIETPPQRNAILRNGDIQYGGVICELGVFGTCVWRTKAATTPGSETVQLVRNEQAGYLLRTKGDSSEEGGVAAGFGAVDSCCLLEI